MEGHWFSCKEEKKTEVKKAFRGKHKEEEEEGEGREEQKELTPNIFFFLLVIYKYTQIWLLKKKSRR